MNASSPSLIDEIEHHIKTSKKLKELTINDKHLGQTLLYIFKLVGLPQTAYPIDADYKILCTFILKTYSNLSVEELRMAFELALKQEFYAELNHYQTFSPLYFSGVINNYIEYRKKAIARINKERMVEEAKQPELTPEEIELSNRKFDYHCVYKGFLKFKESNTLNFGHVPISYVYDRLTNQKQLIKLSENDKKKIVEEVSKEFSGKLLYSTYYGATKENKENIKSVRDIISGKNEIKQKIMFKNECMAKVITIYFLSLIKNKINFLELLKIGDVKEL